MNTKEIFELEEKNADRIVLLKSGMFWRAHERSAYAVVNVLNQSFKVMKKEVKGLEGKEIVYVGMPDETRHKVFAGYQPVTDEEARIDFLLKEPIDIAAFEKWKASVPISFDKNNRKNSKGDRRQDGMPMRQNSLAHRMPDLKSITDERVRRVVERLCTLTIANMTPMQCAIELMNIQEELFE